MQRITIIGLGLIGSSIGMALRDARKRDVELIGYDADSKVQDAAKKMGAVDQTEWNLDNAVSGSDIVVVATPASAIPDVFEAISPYLKDGATVTDTASTKRAVLDWAVELLPRHVGFVGGNPLTGAGLNGQRDASEMLFHGERYAIVSAPTTHQSSVANVVSLVEDLGAKPFFLDRDEHDSFMAAVSGLPTVLSAALMSATAQSPSWGEISRFVGMDFNAMTGPSGNDPALNHSMCVTNPDMLTHWVDQLIVELQGIRSAIIDEQGRDDMSGPLADTFVRAWEARKRMEAGVEPSREMTREPLPSAGEGLLSMFLGRRAARIFSNTEEKKDPNEYDRRKMG